MNLLKAKIARYTTKADALLALGDSQTQEGHVAEGKRTLRKYFRYRLEVRAMRKLLMKAGPEGDK